MEFLKYDYRIQQMLDWEFWRENVDVIVLQIGRTGDREGKINQSRIMIG